MSTEQKGRTKNRVQKTFVVGAVSGMITGSILQPFDVIRTHLQAPSLKSSSMSDTIRTIIKTDGVRGLWRGTGPTCIRVGIGAGIYFALLDHILTGFRSVYPSEDGQVSSFLTVTAGAVTRSIASTVVSPITIVKTRMEYGMISNQHYSSTLQAISILLRKEGLGGLFKGIVPTIARDAPYSGLYLLFYSRLRTNLKNENISQTYSNFLAGGISAAISTIITHPPDVIRTRIQLEASNNGALAVAKYIIREEGISTFFRGLFPRMGKRAFQQALTWTIYEELAGLIMGNSLWEREK